MIPLYSETVSTHTRHPAMKPKHTSPKFQVVTHDPGDVFLGAPSYLTKQGRDYWCRRVALKHGKAFVNRNPGYRAFLKPIYE